MMLRNLGSLLALSLVALLAVGCPQGAKPARPAASPPTPAETPAQPPPAAAPGWQLTSPAFRDGETLPAKYTADGADVSPALEWTAPPAGTVELALLTDDVDAPGGTFVHWILYGLPTSVTKLPEAVPMERVLKDLGGGKQGQNDFGNIGYGGPKPPPGKVHHYRFQLHALDAKLALKPGAKADAFAKAIAGHILATATLTGTYRR